MKFAIGDNVVIKLSDASGTIAGRAEYNGVYPNSYWVTFVNGQGDVQKSWFDEQDLTTA